LADRHLRTRRIAEVLVLVGLDASVESRYAHELSGGQLRRIALARILLLEPDIIILDEPTAGLDMSVQATVLSLLSELRGRLGLTYLIISHDLSLVRRFCDRVAILYLGRIVETAPVAELFDTPRHPYTNALLDAMLSLEPGAALDAASLADDSTATQVDTVTGCNFRARCPHAAPECAVRMPQLEPAGPASEVACWRWRSLVSSI
jgi:oligopeptide/dipeptide ABC transporter ATP-binding protein